MGGARSAAGTVRRTCPARSAATSSHTWPVVPKPSVFSRPSVMSSLGSGPAVSCLACFCLQGPGVATHAVNKSAAAPHSS